MEDGDIIDANLEQVRFPVDGCEHCANRIVLVQLGGA